LSVKIVKIDLVLDVILCLWCGGKIGSFGFACVSAFAVGAKTKCANVSLAEFQNILCGGKK